MQHSDTARPGIAQVQSISPHASKELAKGWLTTLKHWIIGERDPVEQQMREIARQGIGMVRLAHTMGTIMILAFSLGSAVGICSTLIDSITRAGMFTWAAVPFDIAFVVSVLLVVCFDVASVYASFMVRLLYTRHAPRTDYTWHIAIIVLACVLESGTFGYMSWKYDDPALLAVAILIVVRAVGSPIVALYLNMARQIPISPSDISYHNFLAAGKGVIRDVVHVANDHTAPLADKIELYGASYAMRPHEERQFERLMAAAEKRDARLARTQRGLPAPHIVAASQTLPLTETLEHHVASASAYKAMHDPEATTEPADPWTDEVYDEDADSDLGDAPWATGVMGENELAESIAKASAPDDTKQRSRTRNTSGPTRRASQASKTARETQKKVRQEAKQARKRQVRDGAFTVFDEQVITGESLSLDAIGKRVREMYHLETTPSNNTIMRLRGAWNASRAHKAALDAAEVEPMEPQELRELVTAEVW